MHKVVLMKNRLEDMKQDALINDTIFCGFDSGCKENEVLLIANKKASVVTIEEALMYLKK